MSYIGLDIGTTGCKATLIKDTGRIVACEYMEYPLLTTSPGYVEIDARTVWKNTRTVLGRLARQSLSPVRALAVASFGEALVLLDERGDVINNSILFSDIRGKDELQQILASTPKEELEALTGMPINAMYSLNKLLWIINHEPEQYKKANKIMLFGDFITYKLCGEAAIDYSLASRTMMFNIVNKTWADSLFSAFSIDSGKFSLPVPSGTAVGTINKQLAAKLGFKSDMLIVAGGHDQACAALGAGVLRIGEAIDGLGTSECIATPIDSASVGPTMFASKFCCEPHVVPNRYLTLAFNTTSGSVIRWYRDTFEQNRYEQHNLSGTDIYDILNKECSDKPSPLLLLPHFAGSGTPHMDPFSSGALLGLKLDTTKADIYKAILEGICFEIMVSTDRLAECGVKLSEVVAVGGGSKSSVLLQIKADMMGIPISTLQSHESGTVGLAILCAIACGDYPDVESAVKALVRKAVTFTPRQHYHEYYAKKYESYKRIYPAMLAIYEAEYRLRS